MSAADSRIIWLPRKGEKNGANVCRNQGLRKSRGDYIVFLDSDDLLEPDCLERRVGVMRRNLDLDFAVFEGDVFEQSVGDLNRTFSTNHSEGDLDRFLRLDYPWEITSPIWKIDVLSKLSGFDESLMSWQDVDLHLRALISRFIYIRIPKIDHHIRWQSDMEKTSLMHRYQPEFIANSEKTVEKFELMLREKSLLTWRRERSLAGIYFQLSVYWTGRKEVRRSLSVWRRAKRKKLVPTTIFGVGWLAILMLWISPHRFIKRAISKWRREFQLCLF